MHSCILDLGFGDFQNFWGFCGPIWYIYSNSHFHILNNITHISTHFFTHTYFKNYKQHYSNYSTKHPLSFSWNFWVGFCEIVSICSCITFSLHSNYVSCIIDVCLIIVECVLVGFDWVSSMMQFKFCTSHVHAYFMHTYPFIPIYGCDFVSLSLSLSHIDYARHPKPPRAKIIFKVLVLLLLIPFPLIMFGFVMRRPERTSKRTFRNVEFIQSAMLFFQTFLTLLSPPSFGLGAGNLYVRDS